MSHVFVGPSFLEVRPFSPTNLWSRLVQQIPYGETVWRDAAGVWHQKYAPSLLDLAGATAVYGGGRVWPLTPAEAADLISAGYGAYLTPQNAVGDAVVGVALVG